MTAVEGEGRFYPNPGKPILIYLPGVHGDTTLFSSFHTHAVKDFQLLEITYPRNTEWSLSDYACYVQQEIQRHGIVSGWLLAESYSSQVAWAMMQQLGDSAFRPHGIILAGGFARYPFPPLAAITALAIRGLPSPLWRAAFWFYAQYAQFRHRNAAETKASVEEFVRRRTPQDLAAMAHRVHLLARNDPGEIIRNINCPIYLLAGSIDPIVLTWPVLQWLRRNCSCFAGHRIIWPADHNVLGTEPQKALAQISEWITRAAIPNTRAAITAS